MIHFYGSSMSSASRSHWMLEEVGVPYEYHRLNIRGGDTRKPEFLAISPGGKVPCLRDGELTLVESMAINFYLAEKYGKDLVPSAVGDRARAYEWSFWAISNVQPLLLTILLNAMILPENERDPKAIERSRPQITPYLEVLDRALTAKEHLLGGGFTVADLNAASVLQLAPMVGVDLAPHRNVTAWLNRIAARPALGRSMAKA